MKTMSLSRLLLGWETDRYRIYMNDVIVFCDPLMLSSSECMWNERPIRCRRLFSPSKLNERSN